MPITSLPIPFDFSSSSLKFSPKFSFPSHFSPNSQQNPFHFFQHRITFHQHKTHLPSLHILFCSSPQSSSSNNNPQSDHQYGHLEKQAQEAISQLLQELGLPVQESDSISLTCPKYTKMLIESVQDLEDWNKWKNGDDFKDGGIGVFEGFKEKVFSMAKEKGDDGKAAFLESIGLSLPSAMYFARYASGESLLTLIRKVKYMKEILFSDSDDKGFFGKNARRMMMCLSISIDDDVQRTLSFFQKIEARRGGLNMLGCADSSFHFLVGSFPRLLLLSVESHLIPVVEFLGSIGVPKECVGKVLLLFPSIILSNVEDIIAKLKTFEKVFASNKDIGKILIKYPWILSARIQENYGVISSFFDSQKVPKASVDSAIRRWPYLLGCSTSKLKLMVEEFRELGVGNKMLGQVIATSPQLLLLKPQEFLQVVSFLEDLGFDTETVGKILVRCPEIFATSTERTLNRKIKFLNAIGVSDDRIPRAIKKYPELLVSHVERTLLPRMNYLMKIGLSEKDVAFMVHRFSPLLGYSIEEVLKPKYEFLVNTMEKPVRDVVDYPRYFSYSLEKKIKPRFWVLKGRNIECSLKDMLGKNDEDFATEFMVDERMLVPPSPSRESK
ncbi:Mitochondrial transcription termination factor family protein putative isoform 2 [Tripterygium wilfordii]|uniref:Mitochondrial transcription termination factor family protein putative isoform 2 n=1 Tax=Tripterygium wilfordii TaxID=458696 RepID=A0A7J7CYM8_TRIWF|nr:transcription termination factor MTERF2, chloroplastic [Tripterygium wilfordii]KAF5739207.1 Mitochondrial transcription termination factor family protein putative isoform 2 [Tripterygium wilfordii]